MKKVKLFVYGTLMQGFCNYKKFLDGNVEKVEKAYTYGKLYHLYDKNCPAIIDGKDKVYGEVITFNDEDNFSLLKKIDELELYFESNSSKVVYKREEKEICYLNGDKEILGVYMFKDINYLNNKNSIYIENGDWKTF